MLVCPYEMGSAVAVLQNSFRKRCKPAVKWLDAAVKFWLLNAAKSSHLTALNSDLTVAQTFSEITISAAERL